MRSLCILLGRLGPRAPDRAAAATLGDDCALPISAEGDDAAAGAVAICPTTRGEAIGVAMAVGGDCLSGATSLVGVAPGSVDTAFTGVVSMEVVGVACFRVALGGIAAVLPDDKAGR